LKFSLADWLTLSRLFFTPFFIFSVLNDYYLISAFLVILVVLSDWLDGIVARKQKSVTSYGKLLDPAVDKIFVISALTAFVEKNWTSSFVVFLIVTREMLVTWIRSVLVNKGIVVPASNIAKYKTTFQLIAIFFFSLKYVLIGNILIWFSIIIAYISAFDYFKIIFKEKAWN